MKHFGVVFLCCIVVFIVVMRILHRRRMKYLFSIGLTTGIPRPDEIWRGVLIDFGTGQECWRMDDPSRGPSGDDLRNLDVKNKKFHNAKVIFPSPGWRQIWRWKNDNTVTTVYFRHKR
jgi:hypothetical protein